MRRHAVAAVSAVPKNNRRAVVSPLVWHSPSTPSEAHLTSFCSTFRYATGTGTRCVRPALRRAFGHGGSRTPRMRCSRVGGLSNAPSRCGCCVCPCGRPPVQYALLEAGQTADPAASYEKAKEVYGRAVAAVGHSVVRHATSLASLFFAPLTPRVRRGGRPGGEWRAIPRAKVI